jgi:hypothetical protein
LNLYVVSHRNRRNLLLHAFTVPLFELGTALLVVGPFISGGWVLAGAVAALGAIMLQGRGHRLEASAPARFKSPWDFVVRIFIEQWATFPRFVISGGFTQARRAARRTGVEA